ncbi:hypothetical protein [Methylotuvimicrobium sp. KM1]
MAVRSRGMNDINPADALVFDPILRIRKISQAGIEFAAKYCKP